MHIGQAGASAVSIAPGSVAESNGGVLFKNDDVGRRSLGGMTRPGSKGIISAHLKGTPHWFSPRRYGLFYKEYPYLLF